MDALNAQRHIRVFISYSHDSQEHESKVGELASRLRSRGIDCQFDQYEPFPPQGWPRWMMNEIEQADYVLIVCTQSYYERFRGHSPQGKGQGATWEGAILTQALYVGMTENKKLLPVVFASTDIQYIPDVLRPYTRFDLERPNGYDDLYRLLTNQPRISRPPLGSIVEMPPNEGQYIYDTEVRTASEGVSAVNVSTPLSASRRRLFQTVHDLLTENKVIYDQYGPESMLARKNPLSDAASLWNERKRAVIVPNNQRIIDILEENRDILSQHEYEIFLRFREHALAFAKSAKDRLDRNAVPRFPGDFRVMIEKGLNTNEQ